MTSLFVEHFLLSQGLDLVGNVTITKDAIDAFEKSQPDIVLMDIILKGDIDGIQCAKEMLAKNLNQLIFIISNSDTKTKQRAKELGNFPYLVKPLDMKKLTDLILT